MQTNLPKEFEYDSRQTGLLVLDAVDEADRTLSCRETNQESLKHLGRLIEDAADVRMDSFTCATFYRLWGETVRGTQISELTLRMRQLSRELSFFLNFHNQDKEK